MSTTLKPVSETTQFLDTADIYLIIGAGPVGLSMAKALKEAGIIYEQVDASDGVGGNWHHGVYETAHIISSRKVTQFSDFPMPEDYPDFPSARQMEAYFNAFADHFELRSQIRLNCEVISVQPAADNRWLVEFKEGEQDAYRKLYKGVLLCSGHHWCKQMPEFVGQFNGDIIHSKDYKHPDQLRGKRVLVIGGGNSACDIAAEAGRVGAKSVLSLRESVWFIPKTFSGVPVVDLIQWWMPEWFQRGLTYLIIRTTFGRHEDYGLPEPSYRIFAKHPTLNNEVPYYLKHGRIQAKPEVEKLDGSSVWFVDGSREEVDLIVCATGYQVAYPFLPTELQRVKGATVQCYGGAFLDDYKGLYFVGWGQARGGIGSLLSAFGPLFTQFLKLDAEIEIPLGLALKKMGFALPDTHLSDPQTVFRTVAIAKRIFPLLRWRVKQIDTRLSETFSIQRK
ncbi:MAG: NAD(P)-binding domain-containing protein [Cyanobacteria bacterium P01_H01_bin.15]